MAQFASCADLDALKVIIEQCCATGGGTGSVEVADQTSITGVGTTADPFKVDTTWLAAQITALETVTALQTFSFDPLTNTITIQYLDENNAVTTKTVNLTIPRQGVLARKAGTPTQTYPNNATTIINGWTNLTDTTSGAWNPTTGVFTATRAGWYDATVNVLLAGGAWNAGGQASTSLWKNGVIIGSHMISTNTAIVSGILDAMTYTTQVYLGVGDTLDARIFNLTGSSKTNYPQPNHTTFSIVEIGA